MLCFIHIERAGGTTLHHILRSNYISFLTLPPQLWTNDPQAVFTAAELQAMLRLLPFTRGFGGHTTRVYAGYETATAQPLHYFTFLREPVQRYISQFQYQVERMGVPWSFESFLAEPRFANFMTHRIAGGADVQRAKELLRERFAFVGLTERFDESLLLMRHALGLPAMDVRYERQNAGGDSPAVPARVPLGGGLLRQAHDRNRLDLELYEYARTVLYPEYIGRYGPALSQDLDRFRTANAGFRFSPRRRLIWGLYRKIVYQPAEFAARRKHRAALVQ